MDIAAESDESRSLVRVAIWAGQNAHDPGLYLLNDSNYPGLYSEEAFIRGNTVHVNTYMYIILNTHKYMYSVYIHVHVYILVV